MKNKLNLGSAMMRYAGGSDCKLVQPLDLAKVFGGNYIRTDGKQSSDTLRGAFVNACVYYALEQMTNDDGSPYESPSKACHLAIGRNTAKKGGDEDVMVEFQDVSEPGHPVVLVYYVPYDGGLMAATIDDAKKHQKYYLTPPPSYFQGEGTSVGTPIWLAVLPELLADADFAKAFAAFSQYVRECDEELKAGGDTLRTDEVKFLSATLPMYGRMKDLCIEAVDDDEIVSMNVPSDMVAFNQLSKSQISGSHKSITPSMSKIIFGKFEYFECAGNFSKVKARGGAYKKEDVIREICSKMTWTNPCTSPEEQALIPHEEGVITQRIVDLVTALVESKDNPLATRKRFFMIEGPAGVGKSFNARMFAELYSRPFVVQTVSPTDQKEDLIGSIVPITHGQDAEIVAKAANLTETEKAVLEAMNTSTEENLYDNVAKALGYPSSELIFFDPKGSYKQIAGTDPSADEPVTASLVIGMVNRSVTNSIAAIGNKCKDNSESIRKAQEAELTAKLKKVRSKALAILMEAKNCTDAARLDELKKDYNALISDEKVCAYSPLNFELMVDLFKSDIQAALPYIPGYNGNLEDFLTKYKEELDVEYKFIPSPFVRAFQNGWVCELQEATCLQNPSALSGLHDALEPESLGVINTPYGEIRRHPDFVCIATQNRQYAGTKPLNAATRSRFQYFDAPDRLTAAEIKERIKQKCEITDNSQLDSLAEIYQTLESKAREERMSGEMTMRALYNMAAAFKQGHDRDFVLKHYGYWAISTDEDDVAALEESLDEVSIGSFQ